MGARIVEHANRMPGARFFPDATLNFAENLLRRDDDGVAILFKGEGQLVRTLTFGELCAGVAGFAAATARSRASGLAIVWPDTCPTSPKR